VTPPPPEVARFTKADDDRRFLVYHAVLSNGDSTEGGDMGRTLTHDIALAETWGYSERDAVRLVARMTLLRADEGVSYDETYLRDLHRMMVTTA
jgi:hypothetical protein